MGLLVLFAMVIVLLAIGVPIAISLGLSSVVFLMIYSDSSLASVAQTLFSAFEGHYTLLAIPFFILASSFMATGGVARRIIRFAIACVGHLPGGLAIAGVFACMLFAALSGNQPGVIYWLGRTTHVRCSRPLPIGDGLGSRFKHRPNGRRDFRLWRHSGAH